MIIAEGDIATKFPPVVMNAESNTVLQHTLFSNHKQFEVQLARDLQFSLIKSENYAGIFFTLMGYFSTMQGTDISDQVTGESVKTFKILITGHDYDRFYILFMAKTMVSERLTGRLFYFHLNENAPLLTDHFGKTDIDVHLKSVNPGIDETALLQWIQHIENNCLYIKIKTARLGSTSNERLTNKGFAVDATFYRATNLFQQDQRDATSWRELKMTELMTKTKNRQFFEMSREIYNTLFVAFMKNSVSMDEQSIFTLSKEYFLHFVYGALQYNIKTFRSIKITPIYIGSYLEKLAILEYDQKKWVTDSPPIIFEVHQPFDEASSVQIATRIDDLPIDFLSNSKFALVESVVFGPTIGTESAQFFTKRVQIENKNGLVHFLKQIMKLEHDEFYNNLFEIRKQLLVQLSRIDAFLGHEHKTGILRHFLFSAIMSTGGRNAAYKLKHRFDELNPVDIFLIQSSESSGLVVAMSTNTMSVSVSDPIADILLNTGLKKMLVLTINDQAYEQIQNIESTTNPFLDMMTQDSMSQLSIDFHESLWRRINPLPSDHYFSNMLINEFDEHERSISLQTELTSHSMCPNSLREFEAQIKGFAAGKHIFTPYGYEHILIGIRVERLGGNEDMNRFGIPAKYGDTQRAFHIILQLNPNLYSTHLNRLKNFFKSQLLSSGLEKINAGLIRPTVSRDIDNSIKYEFYGSFPNGIDAREYTGCLPRRRRAGGQNCLLVEEEDNSEIVSPENEHDAIITTKGAIKIGKFVNKAIYFQMIKGIIGSAMDGDFTRMAKESGILAGMFGVGVAGEIAVQWGRSLLKKNRLLKGGTAYLGGKLLSKAYLGFVIADLVARSKAYELGDKDQLVGIVGDAAILTINLIPLTLEIYSAFVSVEEASAELGPEVMIAETVIFAIIDGFYAVRSVLKIEKYLQLSWGEDFVQWTRSFFGAHTSSYLEDLTREKALLQMAVDDAAKKIQLQNNTFAYYATPTLTMNKKGNIFQQENNIIDMNSRTQVWSRAWPKTKQNLRIECASSGIKKQASRISSTRKITDSLSITTDGTLYQSYFCKNMITLSTKNNRMDDLALIALGYGTDVAKGFQKKSNYFIIGGGEKQVTGGELVDIFHFIGNDDEVHGSIDGREGGNTLDLSQYLMSRKLVIDLENETLAHTMNTTTIVRGIENVIGRTGSVDRVICSCRTRYLDLKGGKSNVQSDAVLVPAQNCTSKLTIKLSGYINIENMANKMSLIYLVTSNTDATISNMFNHSTYQSDEVFFLPMNLSLIDSLESISINNTTFTILKSEIHNTTVVLSGHHENSNFIFADEYQVSYSDSIFHARREVQQYSSDDKMLREKLLMISHKLNITVTVFSKVNNELIQVHNIKKPKNSIEQKVSVTHFSNEADYKSNIITTNYGKNYFQIYANCNENFTKVNCWMKNLSIDVLGSDDSKSNIIDVSSIDELLLQYGKKLEIVIKNFTSTFVIDLKDELGTFGSIDINYDSPTTEGVCTKLLINIRTLMHVCYDKRLHAYALYPIPLKMNDDKSVLVLSQYDVEQNMTIQVDRQMPNFICQSYNDSLILTNSVMKEDPKDEFTLIFIDYFPHSSNLLDNQNGELFDSIIFEFKDKEKNKTATVKEFIGQCNFLIQRI